VSHLAREIGFSRPLLHMYLQELEAAGLIVGRLELSALARHVDRADPADGRVRTRWC
jgi:ArsR family transcriptional regulator